MGKNLIRDKIKKLQVESDEILKSSDISKEVRLFITSMMFMIDIVVDVLLIKKIRKTSSNSGAPPSQNFGSNGNRNKPGDSESDKKGSQPAWDGLLIYLFKIINCHLKTSAFQCR